MKAINAALLALLFAAACLGQDKKAAEYERQEQKWREHEERVAELDERLAELQHPAPRFIESFVGRTGNSWAISLVSEGGFFGFRTIAAMNSEKKAYCGFDNDSMVLVDVPEDLFAKLQSFLDRPPFASTITGEPIAGCRDCSNERIVVSIRSGGSVRSQTYIVSDRSPYIFRLYEAMYDFAGCRKRSEPKPNS